MTLAPHARCIMWYVHLSQRAVAAQNHVGWYSALLVTVCAWRRLRVGRAQWALWHYSILFCSIPCLLKDYEHQTFGSRKEAYCRAVPGQRGYLHHKITQCKSYGQYVR